jgi:phosphoenolpyruvate carboxylase
VPASAADGRRRRPLPDPLRRDVRLLTTLLGDAIAETDQALFDDVERLRRAAIALREDPTPARRRRAERIVASLDPERAERVARAFTAYFQLVNVAEELHRVRELRERSRRGTIHDSIEAAVRALEDLAHDPSEAVVRLAVTEVLTAHPTEAKRRAVVEHLWRIGDLLDRLDDPRVGRTDEQTVRAQLAEEVAGLWGTDPVRAHAPEPLDEVRAVMALFDQTIFRVVPAVYRELHRCLAPDRAAVDEPRFAPFLRWGTWVGGDRDGNPFVTADVTLETLAIQRDHVMRGYENAARRIARGLSVSTNDVPASRKLLASLARDASELPARADDLARKLPDAPHRRKLALVAERLAATRAEAVGGYPDAASFVGDLGVLQRSLAGGGAPRLAFGELQGLRWQAETFGFHLASVEVRQHAEVHRAVLAELAPKAVGDARALDRIARGLLRPRGRPRSPAARELVATFRAVREAQRRFGVDACRRWIVSFTREAADLATVAAVARLACGDDPPELDVVPLFETRHELANATSILDEWLALPHARRWLRSRGGALEVMVGYSDSAKEAGMLAANLELYETQAALAAWARTRDVRLTIFHGRGGALGRGGGPTNRAILGQPAGSVDGRFKVTEQGEVAFARYGRLEIAQRHLEQLTHAVLLASVREPGGDPHFAGELRAMAEASERAWRELLGEPGFAELFRAVTPIRQIGTLSLGSRPASRWGADDLEQLRAIPWVFAWAQSRVNLPGWFGVGTGLEAVAARRGGRALLRRMHGEWPFFAVLMENVELSLAKGDRAIAERYLARGDRADLTARILDEFDRTERLVLAATGRRRLLEGRPPLRAAVDLRNPYVDALSFLQLRFLDERGRAAERTVRTTIGGVAAGLQNTG